jgi:hypothetical protein
MDHKDLSALTNEELLQVEKKMKSTAILNAVFIGFLVGVVIFSFMKHTLGLVTLIPLFFAYKLVNRSRYDKQELEAILKQRQLK